MGDASTRRGHDRPRPQELPPVVFGVDERYAYPLCVAIASLASASRAFLRQVRVVVLHEGLSEGALAMIRDVADETEVSVRVIATRPVADYPSGRWPSSAYLRLQVPTLLPEEPRALYLDTDVLVLGDLRPLLLTDLGSTCLAAAVDPLAPTVGNGMLPGWKELGVPEGSAYFNSGVMLMDLAAWRSDRLSARCHEFLMEYPQYVSHPDQDALNYLVGGSWIRLDRRWNAYAASALDTIGWLEFGDDGTRRRRLLADERDAFVLHFAGPLKPWSPGFPAGPTLDLYGSFASVIAGPAEGPRAPAAMARHAGRDGSP